jgi:hypothetical protein
MENNKILAELEKYASWIKINRIVEGSLINSFTTIFIN